MPISKPHSSLRADNKGSCSNLALYLEKENEYLDKSIAKSNSRDEVLELESRKQRFFTALETNISTIEVISTIDANKKKLGANDAKYFAPSISFSKYELEHLAFLATGKRNIESVWDLSLKEIEEYNRLIREYGQKVMDNYALNFNRQDKGIQAGTDLVYFGKIEHFRKFKGTDKDVIKGKVKSGTFKPGLQSHIHCIVSRKDKTQQLKLSPTCNEINTKRVIGGNNYQVGFDRVKWIEMNERTFDEHFKYQRKELEKFKNQNILKNGSPLEKHELNELLKANQTSIHKTIEHRKSENDLKNDFEIVNSKENYPSGPDDYQKELIVTQESTHEFEDNSISDIDKKKKRKSLNKK
jgi:Family of unknown function (DUF5712)